MQMLPRYVQQRVSPSGDISYRFNPPQMLVDEGVVERDELGTDTKEVSKVSFFAILNGIVCCVIPFHGR